MTRVTGLVSLALAIGGATACRQTAPSASVSAEVKDFTTGEPVAGATVRLIEAKETRDVTQTDPAGRFAVTRLGEKATLEVVAVGKQPLRRTLRLAPGEDRALDLFMVPAGGRLPDESILFERGGNIWRTDAAGIEVRNLTAGVPGIHASPTWNGERSQFGFIQRIPGRTQILTRYADGTPGRFIGEVPDSVSQLRWSPEGRVMVFAHAARTSKGQYSELRAIDIFSGIHKDVVGGQEERDPAWSRDGRFLIWSRFVPGRTFEIWQAGADGGATRAVLTGYNAREGTFSPDGKRIVFSSNYEDEFNLYEVATEAPRPRRLTSMPPGGYARRPLFGPLGDSLLFETNVVRGQVQTTRNLAALNLRTLKAHEVLDDVQEATW